MGRDSIIRDKAAQAGVIQDRPVVPCQQLLSLMKECGYPTVSPVLQRQRLEVIQMMLEGREHDVWFGFNPKENLRTRIRGA